MSVTTRSSTLAPLLNRDFRFLMAGFAIGQMLTPLQFVTQILWVQHYAPNDIWLILVALIATSRGLGALLFGLYGGALADRFDKRQLLLVIQTLQVACTLVIALLMHLSVGSFAGFALFFLLTFISSGLMAIDAPTRLAIVPELLPADQVSAGLSLNQVAGQLALPLAMMMLGILVDRLGFSGAYLTSAAGQVIAIACIALMHYRPGSTGAARPRGYGMAQMGKDIRIGLRYARQHAVIFWVIMLLVCMMGLGFPPTGNLGPTWVTTVVKVPIPELGYVVMFWGLGSISGAVLMTRLASYERRGLLLAGGALLFCVSFLVFVAWQTRLNVMIGNFGLGAGMTITMVSSTILIQHLAPSDMRGRLMSILQLNMAFAQLMAMPAALLGQWLTLPVLFPILAWLTLGCVLLILLSQRQVICAVIARAPPANSGVRRHGVAP